MIPSSPRQAGSESNSRSGEPKADQSVKAMKAQYIISGRKRSEVIGTVRAIYDQCGNTCVKDAYAACGWVVAISENFSSTHVETLKQALFQNEDCKCNFTNAEIFQP